MMNFKDNLPIYIQIINLIKKRIISGGLKEGAKLPSVRELSTEVKTNPNTVQRAYSELEREDLVFTQRGLGTFVTEDKEVIENLKKTMASDIVRSFIVDMKSIGFKEEEILNLINKKMKEN
jgi:DNA-binding transcriptional regulator YhcF (GntR family)